MAKQEAKRKKTYELCWRNKFLTLDAKSIDDMAGILEGAAKQLREMQAAGVTLDPESGVGDDYASLITSDPEVAKKFGMEEPETEE